MTACTCTHQSWHHGWDGQRHNGCGMCLSCGRVKPGAGQECCLTPDRCPCQDFHKEPSIDCAPVDPLRDAATRATVWGVIADAALARQKEATTDLSALEPGDTIAGRIGGQLIGKAAMTNGRTTFEVTDEDAFLAWVKRYHPTEIVESVRPAYVEALKESSKGKPAPMDADGVVVDGAGWKQGAPSVRVTKEKDAPFIVAQLLSSGRVQLDGIKALEAAE